ncbi:MAG: nicotinate-nucleotide adenylyltransferase [Paludibacteraceae bacterium]|nr:nicotinate-nucleotide adenylyltransferase [Paludibacteraceae bacterium]
MKHIGIYSGSFNPVHNGHIALADYIRRQCGLDEVWLMVSPNNPLKAASSLMDEQIRLQLVQTALSGHTGLRASDFEFSLPHPSYTVNTLRALSLHYPEYRFSLIIGSDNMALFDRWREWEYIYTHYPVIVYPRKGDDLSALRQHYPKMQVLAEAPLFPYSSTEIRQRMQAGQSLAGMVPPAVARRLSELFPQYDLPAPAL